MQFLTDIAFPEMGWLGDDDVLAAVVVSCAITEVLSLLDGGLTVALVEVGDNLCIQILNFLFQRRQCLNSNLTEKRVIND